MMSKTLLAESVSYKQAVAMLPKDNLIHTIMPSGPDGSIHIGALWDRADILDALAAADCIDVTGENAQMDGYGLSIIREGVRVFIKTGRAE